MPVDFLTAAQEQRYGRFAGEPTPQQLAKYFHLDETDRRRISRRHGDHNKLGFAAQLGTVRFLGTFLAQPTEVPRGALMYLALQLGISDPGCIRHYQDDARWRHVEEIRESYGYRELTESPQVFRLVRWLYTRASVSAERPSVLFDHATAWLVEHKVLLPGVTTLARLIARIRERAAARLWQILSDVPTPEQRIRLEALLALPEDGRPTTLERLRPAPTRGSGQGMLEALERLDEVRALGVGELDLSHVPTGRLDALARHAYSVRAQAISRMRDDRKMATLVAVARELEIRATDDALDLLDVLVRDLLSQAESQGRTRRLRTLKDLDEAALQLCEVYWALMNPASTDLGQVRSALFGRVPPEQLEAAVATIQALARPREGRYYEDLVRRYRTARLILFPLLETFEFRANEAGRSVLDALETLRHKRTERRTRVREEELPLAVVTSAWRRLVFPTRGEVDRRAYTLCVLERLRHALARHDVFVDKSKHWGDPRAQLLEGSAWEAARPRVCRMLRRSPNAEDELALLEKELDQTYRRTIARFDENEAARVERKKDGRETLVLSPLDALEEPHSLIDLRDQVSARLPRVDLPDVLLEVDAWTGFTKEFSHASEARARVEDLTTSLCAELVAQACNLGYEPVVRPGVAALTRGRLSWVAQNYVRGETIAAANARLVDHQATIALAQRWGGGDVASADGLRFVVPVRTINAGPNPRYFGTGRGITYLNFTSDQFTGFSGLVIPGTLRDSIYILEGLLQNETSLRPVRIITDTASYSDLVFGLFRLLRYQFSPRIADLGDARLWRLDQGADYGPLNKVARHRISAKLIRIRWDDMLRVSGSLAFGTVNATELIRALQGGGRPTTLGRAIAEYGRISKTLHLLNVIDDESYRRQMLIQLNRQEGRHSLARAVFHGRRGELRQAYREGQEDQLGALGLVVNAIALWNTQYMEVALGHLRAEGYVLREEDIERLSPLGHRHINLLGRYYFGLPEAVQRGELRPLRDPRDPSQEL
jgi:TnpA family transposase